MVINTKLKTISKTQSINTKIKQKYSKKPTIPKQNLKREHNTNPKLQQELIRNHTKQESSKQKIRAVLFLSRQMGSHSASRSQRRAWKLGMRIENSLRFRERHYLQNADFNSEENFGKNHAFYAHLTHKDVKCFRNVSVHEFYSMKGSQIIQRFILVLKNTSDIEKKERKLR